MYNNPYLFAVPPSWSPFSDHVILVRAAFLRTWKFGSRPSSHQSNRKAPEVTGRSWLCWSNCVVRDRKPGQRNKVATFLCISHVPQDKDSPEHVNQVIEFAPDKFPRMGTLLKDGEFSKGEFIMGNLNEILQKIQGTWGLMPNVGSLSNNL